MAWERPVDSPMEAVLGRKFDDVLDTALQVAKERQGRTANQRQRILVTGAGGYIGRHLIPRLRAEGHEVVSLYRSDGNHEQWVEPWVMADLANARRMSTFLDLMEFEGHQHPDTVIHLAGRVEISLLPNPKGAHLPPVPGPCDIGALYRDNVLATANVLDYCLQAGVKHLIFASTQAVYGMGAVDTNQGFSSEPEFDLLEHYATSKLASEHLLEMGRRQGQMVSILRLPGVYGGDRKDGTVYNMCRDAVTKGKIHVTHTHPVPMNVMHIEDVVAAIVAVVDWKPPTQGWIVGYWSEGLSLDISGSREECSLDLLAKEIAFLAPECSHVLFKTADHPVMNIDGERAQQVLNWHPKPRKERLAQVLEEIRRETQTGLQ